MFDVLIEKNQILSLPNVWYHFTHYHIVLPFFLFRPFSCVLSLFGPVCFTFWKLLSCTPLFRSVLCCSERLSTQNLCIFWYVFFVQKRSHFFYVNKRYTPLPFFTFIGAFQKVVLIGPLVYNYIQSVLIGWPIKI